MVSPAVMGTGTVSNVSAKSVSRNSCSGSGSDFKKVMAASLSFPFVTVYCMVLAFLLYC